MKKTLILSAFMLMFVPAAAQAEFSLFKAAPKATSIPVATPATPQTTATTAVTENTEDTINLNMIESRPLYIRRQIVAGQLNDILLKLNILTDKTKAASGRLAQNDIDTNAALTDLSAATLTLAQAKLSIDTLTTLANDPKNEAVLNLMVGTETYKDSVIAVEGQLRAARQSIINSLASLKAAVSAAASVSAQ